MIIGRYAMCLKSEFQHEIKFMLNIKQYKNDSIYHLHIIFIINKNVEKIEEKSFYFNVWLC